MKDEANEVPNIALHKRSEGQVNSVVRCGNIRSFILTMLTKPLVIILLCKTRVCRQQAAGKRQQAACMDRA